MLARLTKRTVDAVKSGDRDMFLWDSDLKGFGLKVTPKNRRIFVVQYWAPHLYRVRRRITLGIFGTLTVEQAREAATRILGRVANGHDPAEEASHERQAVRETTVALLSIEYLDEVAPKLKPTTAKEYRRMFAVQIVPTIGKKPVAHVTERDVTALHIAYRKHPYQANSILKLLRTFLYWCERRSYCPRNTNPCHNVKPFPEQARERFLTVEEIGKLGAALSKAETDGLPPAPVHRRVPRSATTAKHRPKSSDKPIPANPFAVAALRFLLLTGWREQEALTLRWQDVDFMRGMATLPDTKTGKSHRPLGAPAMELLVNLPRIAGTSYVFPGAKVGQPLKEIRRVWYAARHSAGLDNVRLHDLRHTVASFAVGSGHSLYLTGKLLGHARAETTQRYAHIAEDARKAVADSVANAIAAALDGGNTPVTPLRVVS